MRFFTLATVYITHSLDAGDRLPRAEQQHAESQMRSFSLPMIPSIRFCLPDSSLTQKWQRVKYEEE